MNNNNATSSTIYSFQTNPSTVDNNPTLNSTDECEALPNHIQNTHHQQATVKLNTIICPDQPSKNDFYQVDLEQDKTTSDSLESMGRFKRPNKLEMKKLHGRLNQGQNQICGILDDDTEASENLKLALESNQASEVKAKDMDVKYFMASSSQETDPVARLVGMSHGSSTNALRKSLDTTDVSDTDDVFNRTNLCSDAEQPNVSKDAR